jgi:hypothetical protein
MKTKLVNFRVEAPVHAKIKRAAQAAHQTVTEFLLAGAAMRMRALARKAIPADPLDEAFEELFRAGKVSALSASERELVKGYEGRKAAGTLKTQSAKSVLAEIRLKKKS